MEEVTHEMGGMLIHLTEVQESGGTHRMVADLSLEMLAIWAITQRDQVHSVLFESSSKSGHWHFFFDKTPKSQ